MAEPTWIAQNATMVRVDVLAFDGVLDAALGVTRDVLAAANRVAVALRRAPPFRVRLLAPRLRLVTGTGLAVRADARLGPRQERDVLVVLGMNVPTAPELAAALQRPDIRAALPVLRRAVERRTLVCASCSATFVLAEAGVLDGRPATTSWWLAPELARLHPGVDLRSDAMVVPHGNVVTAGAALSQVDLMLWLVRKYAGPEVAELVMRYLVVDERPSQGRYLVAEQLVHHDADVARADAFARRAMARDIDVGDLARAARLSPRTLERRFRDALATTPKRYLQRLRVERAIHLLATTKASVEAIADRVGYRDAATLRRLLRRETGASPSELRARPHLRRRGQGGFGVQRSP